MDVLEILTVSAVVLAVLYTERYISRYFASKRTALRPPRAVIPNAVGTIRNAAKPALCSCGETTKDYVLFNDGGVKCLHCLEQS